MEATTKMASNATHYNNLTPAQPLDKATLNKMVLRSLNLQASFNYERMQAAGWLYCILPGLEKIHSDNKEDLELSMEHNLEFFNTHPFLVTFVMGIILSLEQQKADIETIRAVRVAAMGPLGGIGDAIFWFTLVPITAGITSNMAINGSLAGPILFLLIFNIVQFACRFFLMYWSYNLGTKAIDILTANAKEFTRAASMLGVFIVGALTSNYGGTTVATVIENGDSYPEHSGWRPAQADPSGSDPRPVLPDEEEELEARYLHRSAAGHRSGRRILRHLCLRHKPESQCTRYFLILMGRCSLIPASTWRRGQRSIMNCIPKIKALLHRRRFAVPAMMSF